MKGVVFLGDRQFASQDFPDPTPGFGEVVLEMKASGMCGSDLKQYRRQRGVRQNNGLATPEGPTIAGHEPCGVVAAIGPGVDPRVAKEGAAGDGAPLPGLHHLRPLPHRLEAALRRRR